MSDSEEHLLENMRAQYSLVSEEKICAPKPSRSEGDSCENGTRYRKHGFYVLLISMSTAAERNWMQNATAKVNMHMGKKKNCEDMSSYD